MKHLKIYEEFNQYFTPIESSVYQMKVCGDEYPGIEFERKYAEINWEAFTDYEIRQIKLLLNSEDYEYTIFSTNSTGNNKGEIVIDGFPTGEKIEHIEMENITISIIKLKDEWYYILQEDDGILDHYYACDQFMGLEQCLKTIIK